MRYFNHWDIIKKKKRKCLRCKAELKDNYFYCKKGCHTKVTKQANINELESHIGLSFYKHRRKTNV